MSLLHKRTLAGIACSALAGACSMATAASEGTVRALETQVGELRAALAAAEAALAEAKAAEAAATEEANALRKDREDAASGFSIGPLSLGGAMRVNYVYGDYETTDSGPSRGGNGGNVELDTFRINADLEYGKLIGRFEYRWYAADSGKNYNFMHSGWLGYRFDDRSHTELGLNRVPFGAGPYGVSQSWFFDQHYYVGLSDDSDMGLKYSHSGDSWSWDLGYYWRNEPSFSGRSEDSARYGYDAVRWRETIAEDGSVSFDQQRSGYREKDQFNARAIHLFKREGWSSNLGASLQYGSLDGSGLDDGHHWAASAHAINRWNGFTLGVQFSRYGFDIDGDNPWGTDKLIPLGAYDFAWPVATDAWIPAVSLSYRRDTPEIPWLDYVLPYVEWSGILKDESTFNDSELFVVGAAWSSGGWYIYRDLANSNGNFFVGNEGDDYSTIDGVGDFGVNGNDEWNYRLNLNFGYYY